MKIAILTIGTMGDVAPLLAFGVGLKQSGHSVTVATYEAYRSKVEELNLGFAALPGDPHSLMKTHAGRHADSVNSSFLKYFAGLREQAKAVRASAFAFLDCCLEVCRSADVVVYTLTTPQGAPIAEFLGVPCLRTGFTPITPTRCSPSFLLPAADRFGQIFNSCSHLACDLAMWLPFKRVFNGWCRSRLNSKVGSWRGPARHDDVRKTPLLYGISPCLLPKPADWGEWVHITGHWACNDSTQTPPSNELQAFLDSGPPPVYFGFGSAIDDDSTKLLQLISDTLRSVSARGVIQAGWSQLEPKDSGSNDNLIFINDVSHSWLFPKTAVVVHHGGCGTTHTALHAGIPQAIVGFQGDNMYWGHRCFDTGVASRPIPRKRLTVDNLTACLMTTLSTESYRKKAGTIGQQVKSENGIGTAVALLEQHVASAIRA